MVAQRDNIFAIDIEAVMRAITAANSALSARHADLMAAQARMPAPLNSTRDIERTKCYGTLLRSHLSNCRSARLSDTKPLRDLVKRVEGFFKTMEAETKQAQIATCEALTQAAQGGASAFATVAPDDTAVIEPILQTAISPPHRADVEMTWEVATLNPAQLDLNALRPYFTETALIAAAKRHLKAEGPHGLAGVTYAQKATV